MARITLTAAQHARLVALGEEKIRLLVSETTDQIGLGQFVPVETNPDGTPVAGTDWFTAHPDLQNGAVTELPKLFARLKFATARTREKKIRAIIDKPDKPDGRPGMTRDERRDAWRPAGGTASRPTPPKPGRKVGRLRG